MTVEIVLLQMNLTQVRMTVVYVMVKMQMTLDVAVLKLVHLAVIILADLL